MIAKALVEIQARIENILADAGLVNGIYLDREKIKSEEKIMFWRNFVVVKEGSEKDTYVVWHIEDITPIACGDGSLLYTNYKVNIFINTKQYKILDIIKDVENSSINYNTTFNFVSTNYDNELRSHNYNFSIEGMV